MNSDSQVVVKALPPESVAENDLIAFKLMVIAGGEVNAETLAGLVSRALTLGYARIGEEIVGVSAIKRPNPGYRASVFGKAGAKQEPYKFEYELGWVHVHPSARGRGIGNELVEVLIPSLNGALVYATSHVNNARMHKSLQRFGFEPVGLPYPSGLNDLPIQLFVRE